MRRENTIESKRGGRREEDRKVKQLGASKQLVIKLKNNRSESFFMNNKLRFVFLWSLRPFDILNIRRDTTTSQTTPKHFTQSRKYLSLKHTAIRNGPKSS